MLPYEEGITMSLDPGEIAKGTQLLIKRLEEVEEANPELGDFHAAFEHYCMEKYSLGSSASTERTRTGRKGDVGIDFYSTKDKAYVIWSM